MNYIDLDRNKIINILSEYFEKKDVEVSIKEHVYLDNYNNPNIKYYLLQKNNLYSQECLLTEDDIKRALSNYILSLGFTLYDFKYLGGIHNVGYYFDECTVHYEGIRVYLKDKKLIKKK